MATKPIQAFRLRTILEVDATKGHAAWKASEADVKRYGAQVVKTANDSSKAFKGKEAGMKFGRDFGASATAQITADFSSMGATLGTLIGTAIAPGIGTAVGGTVGSAVDTIMSKVGAGMMDLIGRGMTLKELIEDTTLEFKTFAGSEAEAVKYLDELKKLSESSGLRMGFLIETSERVFDLTGNLKDANLILRAATDQAADFGGKAETVAKIADALGLIQEKGSLAGKELGKLYKLGIDAPRLLSEATGKSMQEMKRLMAAGRIKGDVAARLIAQGIEREKGGYAALVAGTTTSGLRRTSEVLKENLAMKAVGPLVEAQRKYLQVEISALQSETAQKFVEFIDDMGMKMLDMAERAIKTGIRVTGGLAQGILSGDALSTLKSAFSTLSGGAVDMLKGAFEMHSPSRLIIREVGPGFGETGEVLGELTAQGMVRRFDGFMKNEGAEEIRRTLEEILKDPKVKAFFDTIQWAEGGAPNIIVGGKRFSDLSKHPNIVGMRTEKGPSTAAGSYQITGSNWYGRKGRPGLQQQLGLPDFSAQSQQLAALKLFADRDGGKYLQALLAGDINTAMKGAAKDWTSTPGSKIGGGGQKSEQSWMSHFNQFMGGGAITAANPMPVRITTSEGKYLDELLGLAQRQLREMKGVTTVGGGGDSGAFPGRLNDWAQQQEMTLTLGEQDAAIVSVIDHTRDLIAVDEERNRQLMDMVTLPPAMMQASASASVATYQQAANAVRASYALTSEDIQRNAMELIGGMGEQLQGVIGQIVGMVPSQEVGKKRGLFSKILGFAAPFLSFIPGVGPILSTIAGAASNIAGGNYGGALSSIAGGFASGGVFRSSSSPRPTGTGMVNLPFMGSPIGRRAYGGPVRRGAPYIVGEHRPELFIPEGNGRIHPNAGGGDDSPALMAMLERMTRALDRFESMPANEVVRTGARGMLKAMDSNAELIQEFGRRQRLA